MTSHNIRREDADALFAGRAAPGSGLDGLAALFSSLRKAVPDAVPASIEERQLASIRQALAQRTGPAKQRQVRFRAFFAPALVKVAALVMFVLLAGGTLAATGNLPAYQDKVADALSFVFDLPGGTDEADDERPVDDARKRQDAPEDAADTSDVDTHTDAGEDGEQSSGSQDTKSSSGTSLNVESGSSTSESKDVESEGSEEEDQPNDEQEEEELDDDTDPDEPELDD